MKNKKYSSFSSLFSAIILFIFGTVLLKNPDEVMTLITRIIGIITCLVGLFIIGIYTKKKKKNIETTNIDLISGIVFIVFGIIIIIIAGALETALRYILGTWMIFSGVSKLIAALTIGPSGRSYTSMLLLSLTFIGFGIYTILVSNIGLSIIGILIMIYSGLEIFGYVLYMIGGHDEPSKEPDKKTLKLKEKEYKEAKEVEVKDKKKK